jgi:hypothetical protein
MLGAVGVILRIGLEQVAFDWLGIQPKEAAFRIRAPTHAPGSWCAGDMIPQAFVARLTLEGA